MRSKNYPKWICWSCGSKHDKIGQTDHPRLSTFHAGDPNDPTDVCGWCSSRGSLTAPSDYGYPDFVEVKDA